MGGSAAPWSLLRRFKEIGLAALKFVLSLGLARLLLLS